MALELHAKGGHAKQVVLEEREWAWGANELATEPQY